MKPRTRIDEESWDDILEELAEMFDEDENEREKTGRYNSLPPLTEDDCDDLKDVL